MSAAAFFTAVLIAASLCVGEGKVSPHLAPTPSSPDSYGPSGAGPAAAPVSMDCMTNLLNVSDCLSYVMAGSGGASKPDAGCCPEFAGLMESAPQCLCYLLGGDTAKQYGIEIDMAKALKLPGICGVVTPPPSLCSLFGVPVAAPTSMEDTSPASPPGGAAEAPQGSAASPATGDRKSNAIRPSPSSDIINFIIFALVFTIFI